MRFGRLMLMANGPTSKQKYFWCDCGNICLKNYNSVKTGRTNSCGCLRREVAGNRVRKHGETHKTVENKVWKHIKEYSNKHNIDLYDPWNEYTFFLKDVGRRPSQDHKFRRLDKSKGFSPDNCRWMTKKEHEQYYKNINITRGKSWEWQHEYRSWVTMIARCTDPNKDNYFAYGGAGITVCERWQGENGFRNFCEDMGHRPSTKHTLHRKENELGYSSKNCMWLTHRGQNIHKKSSRFIEYKGYRFNLSIWAEITGLTAHTIASRIDNHGYSIKMALTKPVQHTGFIPRTPEEYLKEHNDRIAELYPDLKEEF